MNSRARDAAQLFLEKGVRNTWVAEFGSDNMLSVKGVSSFDGVLNRQVLHKGPKRGRGPQGMSGGPQPEVLRNTARSHSRRPATSNQRP